MCFGRLWTPVTKYEQRYARDGSKPPPLPNEFISLADTAIQDAQAHLKELPSMCPNDRDERPDILLSGSPMVSISIGDNAEFSYGSTRAKRKALSILLQSGDVLIFGGKSRLIYHGVKRVFLYTAPLPLINETGFIKGRLNLTNLLSSNLDLACLCRSSFNFTDFYV